MNCCKRQITVEIPSDLIRYVEYMRDDELNDILVSLLERCIMAQEIKVSEHSSKTDAVSELLMLLHKNSNTVPTVNTETTGDNTINNINENSTEVIFASPVDLGDDDDFDIFK